MFKMAGELLPLSIRTTYPDLAFDFNHGMRLQIPAGNWHVKILDHDSEVVCFDEDISDTLLEGVPEECRANNMVSFPEFDLREMFSCDFDLLILAGDELDDYKKEQDEKKKAELSLPEMDGYTFENFIVGKSNEYAYAAAQGVVKNPGSKVYNPLFIYGNSGLGKTHLLCAIGTAIHEANPDAKCRFREART